MGVDVVGDWIDVFDASTNRSVCVRNDNLETFATGLAPDAFVIFEATGGYERPLMEALEKAGLRHSRVNPGMCANLRGSRDIWPRPTGWMRACLRKWVPRWISGRKGPSMPADGVWPN